MNNRNRLFIVGFVLFLCGCGPVAWIGLTFIYRRADLPPAQIVNDVCYAPSRSCENNAHKLDLYLPQGKSWPVLVFVHGGGWNEGDKQLRVGGADVYANIGRFYAGQGVGVVVINYRLQPETDWRGQIKDVKTALKWVSSNIQEYGGRPDRLFVMGHSAGAYLATFAALTLTPEDKTPIQGVVVVSGAALDLTDQKTYDFGEDIHYYEKRFRGDDSTDGWKKLASPVHFVNRNAPPFLILYAGGEKKGLQRQARCLKEVLDKEGVENQLAVVPGESHTRIVLTLSRPDKASGPEILKFVEKHR